MNTQSQLNESENEGTDESISSDSSIFKNSNEFIEELTKIKNDLKIENDKTAEFKSTFNEIEKEDMQISGVSTNETDVNKELNDKADYSFNLEDNTFKNSVRKILSDVYDLKENLLYPHFEVKYSSKNKSNIAKIYYYQISISFQEKIENGASTEVGRKIFPGGGVGDGNEIETKKQKEHIIKKEEDNNERESFVFLDDRKFYMICFKEISMLFQKNKEGFKNVSIISKDFQSFCEFEIKKIERKD